MAIALADHVCLYHILHGEFRKFHTIEIKYVKKVRFSSGGQFFVIADHKKIFFQYLLARKNKEHGVSIAEY